MDTPTDEEQRCVCIDNSPTYHQVYISVSEAIYQYPRTLLTFRLKIVNIRLRQCLLDGELVLRLLARTYRRLWNVRRGSFAF